MKENDKQRRPLAQHLLDLDHYNFLSDSAPSDPTPFYDDPGLWDIPKQPSNILESFQLLLQEHQEAQL